MFMTKYYQDGAKIIKDCTWKEHEQIVLRKVANPESYFSFHFQRPQGQPPSSTTDPPLHEQQPRLTESSPVKQLHSKSYSVTVEQRANSLLCDRDLMITGNHVKSCDKRARLHLPETWLRMHRANGKSFKLNEINHLVRLKKITKSHLRSGT